MIKLVTYTCLLSQCLSFHDGTFKTFEECHRAANIQAVDGWTCTQEHTKRGPAKISEDWIRKILEMDK